MELRITLTTMSHVRGLSQSEGAQGRDCSILCVQAKPSQKLEVALIIDVAMEHIAVKAVHQDAAFLLTSSGVKASLALDGSARDIR